MRRLLSFIVILLFVPSVARAESEPREEREDDPSEDMRPVRYVSVEANPVAAGVGRFGGQLQFALMGPLALVGGASRIENDALRGWALEVGSRIYFGLSPRRADGSRIAHVWLAASYLADDLRVGATHGERRGVAIDAGVTARLGSGFYALGGVGIAHRSTDLPIVDPFERMPTTPRLLFALGWGL